MRSLLCVTERDFMVQRESESGKPLASRHQVSSTRPIHSSSSGAFRTIRFAGLPVRS